MRLVPSGTPSRTNRYLFPGSRLRLYGLSLAAGLAVLALLTSLVWTGGKAVASPGPLSSAHAPFEKKCATCHSPSVEDVRCEYCHDPFGSNRYDNAGHVWFGTKDPARIARAAAVDCARCHSDHHGRDFLMTRVDERDCATCHFPSMAQHPEFSLVKAGVMKDEGIHFTHKRHVEEMKKARLETCQFCHEPTRDRRGFESLSFDRHCARCHAPGGKIGPTDPIPRAAIVLPEEIGAPWADALAANVQRLPRDKIVVQNLQHGDPWVLYNLWKMSREVDPEGLTRKRAALARKIEELTFQLREPPTKGFAPASLREEEKRLSGRLSELARDPRRPSEPKKTEKALARVRVQIELGPLQMTAPRQRARGELETELAERQSELADFDIGAGPVAPASPGPREELLAAVAAMTSACVKCHVYNGPLMAPVRAARPVLEHANFNHLPHVQQVGCQACHAKIASSVRAEDVNLPAVATCQGCHRPGKSRSDCAECHSYHPSTEPWPPI